MILCLLIAVVQAERQDDTPIPEALAASPHTIKPIPTTATKGNPAELAALLTEDDDKYRTEGTNEDMGEQYMR